MRACWLTLIVFFALAMAFPLQAKVKLAVLDVDSPDTAKLTALLESQLMQLPDVDALERAGLQELLKEQQLQTTLAAGAAAERRNLGKLLKADVLVLLQSKEKPEPYLQLTVFESRQGLRLHAETFFPTAKPLDDARQLSKSVQTALARFRSPLLEIVAVPRFVDESLTHDQEQHGEMLARLLEQELLRRPQVLVVELEEADAISREVALSQETGQTRRLPLYLLGNYRYSTAVENLQVSYALELRRGIQQLDQLKREIPAAAFITSIQLESQKLLETTIGKGPGKIDPAVESQQLIERARVFARLDDKRTAVQLFEAALVLNPDQPAVHGETAYLIHQWAGSRNNAYNRPQAPAREPSDPQELLAWKLARAKYRLRAVPHMEAFYIGAELSKYEYFTRDHLYERTAHPPNAELQKVLDEYMRKYQAMAERVLAIKADRKTQDKTFFLMHHYLLPPPSAEQLANISISDMRLFYFRRHLAENLKRLESFSYLRDKLEWSDFIFSQAPSDRKRNIYTDEYLAYLDQIESKYSNPDIQAAVKESRAYVLKLVNIPFKPEVKKEITERPRGEVDVVRHGIPLRVVQPESTKQSEPAGDPLDWFAVAPGIDFVQYAEAWYWLKTKGELLPVSAPRLQAVSAKARTHARAGSDGRYVWILVPGKDHFLAVIDSMSDGVWYLDAAGGLPPMEVHEGAAVAGLEPGRALLAGYFGRSWIANATLDAHSGIRFEVFHEAKNHADANDPKQKRQLSIAQPVGETFVLPGKNAVGKREYRVCLRRKLSSDFLWIDPQKQKVYVFNDQFRGYYLTILGRHGDSLFVQGAVGADPNKPLGKPLHYELKFPALRLEKTAELPYSRKIYGTFDGETYILSALLPIPMRFSAEFPKKLQYLREELVNKFEERTYFASSHYGLIHLTNHKLYSWERINRPSAPKTNGTETDAAPR